MVWVCELDLGIFLRPNEELPIWAQGKIALPATCYVTLMFASVCVPNVNVAFQSAAHDPLAVRSRIDLDYLALPTRWDERFPCGHVPAVDYIRDGSDKTCPVRREVKADRPRRDF